MSTAHRLGDLNIHFLDQAAELMERLDDAAYAKVQPPLYVGSVGAHLRHALDHYANFLDGLGEGRIDYESRRRDVRIEADRTFARQAVRALASRLGAIPDAEGDREVITRVECGGDASRGEAWARSTVRRELDFLVSHTVHHFALVAMILRLQDRDPGAEFGVAPSTLRHWQRRGSCAP
jgi:uncharacterized damage-inducible protein DinB